MADMACGGVLVGRPAPVAIGDVQMEDYCIRCVHVLPPRQCAWVLCNALVDAVHILCNAMDDLYAGWQSGAWSWWRHLLPWIGATWWETLPHTVAQKHSHTAHSTQYYYTACSTFPPTATERRTVGQRRRSAGSIFIRHHIPAKIVLHLFAEILKPPFILEYVIRSWIKSSWIWKKNKFLFFCGLPIVRTFGLQK